MVGSFLDGPSSVIGFCAQLRVSERYRQSANRALFAALAQEERRLISEQHEGSIDRGESSGKLLGANGKNLAAKKRREADDFASQLKAKLDADLMGESYSEIARQLNAAGVTTATGRKFFPQTVKNYVKRFDKV